MSKTKSRKTTIDEVAPAASTPSQGNKPGMDPRKFGLKFDVGKDRWDLLPPRVILQLEGCFHDEKNFKDIVGNFDAKAIAEEVISDMLTYWLMRDSDEYRIDTMQGVCLKIMQIGRVDTDDRFPWDQIEKVVKIYSYGAKKYQDWNWLKVSIDRYYSACMRHFRAFRAGKIYDEESGFEHRMHALWNAIALLYFDMEERE